MRHWRRLVLLFVILMLTLVGYRHIAANENDWKTSVTLPGGLRLDLRTSALLRLATSTLGLHLLADRRVKTRFGELRFSTAAGALLVECAPCFIQSGEIASRTLRLEQARLTLLRQGQGLSGSLVLRQNGRNLRLFYTGRLDDRQLALQWHLPRQPLADVYAQFSSVVPEVRRARIEGMLSAKGSLVLPQAQWTAELQPEGVVVYRLGTEFLRYGSFLIGRPDSGGKPQWVVSGDGSPGWLTLHEMGRRLPRAVLAVEDSRFYYHPGYDLQELAPLLADPEHPRGGSTITQQLAKNLFVGGERSLSRKLRELLYAVEMERTLGKQRILTLYLNTVYWGPGIYGAEAAARAYFASPSTQLDMSQAAWLAGSLHNPTHAYSHEFLAGAPDRERLAWVGRQLSSRRINPEKLIKSWSRAQSKGK